jgi:hypothetical protein
LNDTLIVKELTGFQKAARRDIIADGMSRPNPITDHQLLTRLTQYGNEYIERAAKDPANEGVVLWFDIHFGDPAVVGMTWAWNPFCPMDLDTGEKGFWRIWSERHADVGSIKECQEALAAYCVQR